MQYIDYNNIYYESTIYTFIVPKIKFETYKTYYVWV